MNLKILATALVLTTTGLVAPVKAQSPATQAPASTSNQVLDACVQNRAETLPMPFSDVPPDHWAFKAVMSMYYCGAFLQATPPAAFEQLRPTEGQQTPQVQPQSQLTPPQS
jgi:hypothetical protein